MTALALINGHESTRGRSRCKDGARASGICWNACAILVVCSLGMLWDMLKSAVMFF